MIPDSRFVQSPDDAQLLPGSLLRLGSIRSKRIANPSSDAEHLRYPMPNCWRPGEIPAGASEGWVKLLTLSSELCFRALGKRPYWTQVLGAMGVMQGRVLEMNTGEGKSLTALLAATAALSQRWPVHVVTANDYLAERDHEDARALFALLGVSSMPCWIRRRRKPVGRCSRPISSLPPVRSSCLKRFGTNSTWAARPIPFDMRFADYSVGEVAARPYVRALGLPYWTRPTVC